MKLISAGITFLAILFLLRKRAKKIKNEKGRTMAKKHLSFMLCEEKLWFANARILCAKGIMDEAAR